MTTTPARPVRAKHARSEATSASWPDEVTTTSLAAS